MKKLTKVLNEKTIEQARVLMGKMLPELDVSIATGQYVVCVILGYIVAQKKHHTDPEELYEFIMKLCGERTWRAQSNLYDRIKGFAASLESLIVKSK